MGEIVKAPIGAESSFEVDLKDGKLVVSVVYDGAQLDGSVNLALDAVALVDKLDALLSPKIPLGIGPVIFAALKGALKG